MVELADSMVPAIAGADRSLRRWIGLGVLLTAIFVAALDNFIVFVAIPSIRSDLGATVAQAEFIVAGYTLSFALGLITSARLGDRFGRRRMFLIGFTSFTVASGLCGAAPDPSSLIVFRIVQGIAGAMLTPQMLAIVRVTFIEAHERATAFAWMGVAIGLGSVLGQVVGGFVVSADFFGLSWRPVFLINLPVGIFALTAGPFVIDESRAPGVQRLDLVGAALSSLGLGLLLYPLIEGREAGWPAWVWAMLVSSSIVLGVFVIHQHRKSLAQTSPLLDTEVFFDRAFCIGLVLILLFYGTIKPANPILQLSAAAWLRSIAGRLGAIFLAVGHHLRDRQPERRPLRRGGCAQNVDGRSHHLRFRLRANVCRSRVHSGARAWLSRSRHSAPRIGARTLHDAGRQRSSFRNTRAAHGRCVWCSQYHATGRQRSGGRRPRNSVLRDVRPGEVGGRDDGPIVYFRLISSEIREYRQTSC
jgi:MFS family permease